MKLRLKTLLIGSVCITSPAFAEPLLVTAANPEIELTDDEATAVLLSAHGDMFEVIADETKAPKKPKAPKAPADDSTDNAADLSGAGESTGTAE